jgi:palmitoyltransferase ZDHHC9/14/18
MDSYLDPGVIPKRVVESTDSLVFPAQTETVILNGKEVVLKYCYTCCIYRPQRAVHCSSCDNCVSKWDHHCPWTGTCIGERNYRWFYSFVSMATIGAILGIALAVIQVCLTIYYEYTKWKINVGEAIGWGLLYSIGSFILMIYFLPTGGFTGILMLFHAFLILFNRTTYEHIKKGKYLFGKGCCCNIYLVFCKRMKKSKILKVDI